MSRSINPVEWLKTLPENSANAGRLVLKTAKFTSKLAPKAFKWTLFRLFVGIVGFYVIAIFILSLLNLTDDPIVNKWMTLATPVTFGVIVGGRIWSKNFRRHGDVRLNGLENAFRAILGGSAVAMETHFAIVSVFWQIRNYIETLNQFLPEGLIAAPTPEPLLPVIAEFIIFFLGLIGLIYITQRAFIMQCPSKQTASEKARQKIRGTRQYFKSLWDSS